MLFGPADPLLWSAALVSEHGNAEAADAFDQLNRAFFEARDVDGGVKD